MRRRVTDLLADSGLTPARTSALPASPGFAAVPLHFPEVLEAELEEPCQRDLALTADLL